MKTLWQDVIYGCRMLLKKPGFTIVAALSLALGIGANTTIFSIINGTLLARAAFPEPDRVAVIWTTQLTRPGSRSSVTYGNYNAWKQRSQSFTDMGAVWGFPSNLGAEQNGAPAEQLQGDVLRPRCLECWACSP
jgi:putative ABC transport system permease protein